MSGEKEWRECVVKHQHGIWTVPLMCSYALPYTDQPIEMIDKRALEQLQREKQELIDLLKEASSRFSSFTKTMTVISEQKGYPALQPIIDSTFFIVALDKTIAKHEGE